MIRMLGNRFSLCAMLPYSCRDTFLDKKRIQYINRYSRKQVILSRQKFNFATDVFNF